MEDKEESVELYETVSNNNDYKVEQKREKKSSSSDNLFWGEHGRQEWKYWNVCNSMKLYVTIMRIQLNKWERSQAPAQARCYFEERVEDKNESIEQYVTVWNNNDNKIEQLREMKARCKLKFKRDFVLKRE